MSRFLSILGVVYQTAKYCQSSRSTRRRHGYRSQRDQPRVPIHTGQASHCSSANLATVSSTIFLHFCCIPGLRRSRDIPLGSPDLKSTYQHRAMPVNASNAVVNGNGANITQAQMPQRPSKPPPPGPAPSAPVTNMQANLDNSNGSAVAKPLQNTHTPPNVNGSHNQKGKKKSEQPVDPAAMYESLKNRIAALEEEEVIADEEERRISE